MSYLRLYIPHVLNVVSHCIESIPIRNYSGLYSVWMQKNTDQNNLEYKDFLRSVYYYYYYISHTD